MRERKARVSDLAVLGGAPAFADPRHVGRPNVGDPATLHRRLDEVLARLWLTNDGPMVREFERRIADLVGTRHAVATCNATLGLQILARACGLRDEVIMPSFTFVATAHALEWIGLTPVFCDIDEETGTLDPKSVRALITPRTTGILGVHLWGVPCETTELADLARTHDLSLLYDAAHALGCAAGQKPVGGFGRAEVFSFHATKFVNSFEGGAVVTDDDALAARLRAMRNFGYAPDDDVTLPGTNAKMSEASAVMGLTSLETLPDLVAVNRANHEAYRDGLAAVPGVRLRGPDRCSGHNFQYVVVEVDQPRHGLSADALATVLRAENVLARRYFHPGCHRLAPYRDNPATHVPRALPHTEALAARTLVLPTGSAMDPAAVRAVCDVIRLAATAADRLADALAVTSSDPRAAERTLRTWNPTSTART